METLTSPKLVKARKIHRCNFCTYLIPKNSVYYKSSHKHDGEVYTWKSHAYCSAIAETLKMYDNADEGVTADWFQEDIKNEYQKIMSETQSELYESKEFKYPPFEERLFFVLKHHNILPP